MAVMYVACNYQRNNDARNLFYLCLSDFFDAQKRKIISWLNDGKWKVVIFCDVIMNNSYPISVA